MVNGTVVGVFLSQGEAERAFTAARGQLAPATTIPVALRPEDQHAPTEAPCGHGEPAPVVGGCWCCLDAGGQPTAGIGRWATDPRYCQPAWCERCGNCAGRNTQPAPRPGSPVSPESSLPPVSTAPAAPAAPAPVLDAATIAARLRVTPGELGLLAGVGVLVLVLA